MVRLSLFLLLLLLGPRDGAVKGGPPAAAVSSTPASKSISNSRSEDGPAYTADGQLKLPEHYREWIFLTSGLNMSYDTKEEPADHAMFDNVFVNPSAYKGFLATGIWPDRTVIVIENRSGESGRSINIRGKTQSLGVMGMEAHVKDAALPGGWGFYGFDNPVSAKLIARPAACYTCHEEHAAVDTTFVQFYPTLVGVAEKKGTVSAGYLKEMKAPVK